jgi:hypothetical protein
MKKRILWVMVVSMALFGVWGFLRADVAVRCWWYGCGGDCMCVSDGQVEDLGPCSFECYYGGAPHGRCTLSSVPFHCDYTPR